MSDPLSDQSTILSLPYLLPAQAQKHITHNEALRRLDLLVQLSVTSRHLNAPPAGPRSGDRYIVAPGATGDWAGQDNAIALFSAAEGWLFTLPLPGWRAFVTDEAALSVWDGASWQGLGGHDNLSGVGVNTSADATNRLAVSAPATLLSHEGAGHQVKINKAAPGETASLLFQTGWSGRAEIGTTGSDGFAIKASADGTGWTTALSIDPATGMPTLPQGAWIDGPISGTGVVQGVLDSTAGRLLSVGYFGIGTDAVGLPSNDVNEAPKGGICWFGMSAQNKPGPSNSAGIVRTLSINAGSRLQQAHIHFPNSVRNTVYHRVLVGGIWSPWSVSYDSGSVLGEVSESNGLPTGAVIERGASVTGCYVRFADGTQICTETEASATADSAIGAMFRSSSDQGWTYPRPFAAAPVLSGMVGGGTSWIAFAAGTPTAAVWRRFAALSDATSQPVRLMAMGRWF